MNYFYDMESRLVSVADSNNAVVFNAVYDYRSRRISCGESGILTKYLYDGGDSVQELNSDGSLKKQFIRGTSLGGGIGGILYSDKSLQSFEFFAYNAIGSTMATTDVNGTIISTNSYAAWGKVIASTGSSDNNRLFCTKERSAVIGLDNFGRRYYDNDLGRFVTRDPAGYPDGANNYLYCKNNPVNKIDPLGLGAKDVDKKIVKKIDKIVKEVEKLKVPDELKDATDARKGTWRHAEMQNRIDADESLKGRVFTETALDEKGFKLPSREPGSIAPDIVI